MNPGKRQLLAAVNTLVTERPGTVVFVFLCVTAGFAVGVGDVSTEAGTEQFTDDIPAAEAAERIDEEFSPAFRPDTGSTQLIQQGDNVLSRPGLLRMLDSQSRLLDRPRLRVTDTASAAGIVATHLDPEAETVAEQRRAVARATDGEIRTAVREADERNPRFAGLLSEDFNPEAATATATIGTLTHERPGGFDDGTGDGAESPLTPIQLESQELVTDDITVFGSGIIAAEFGTIIDDTLAIVLPAAIALITLFLLVAYRDLADLALGVVALFVTLVWTFGFMGFAGIPFSQLLIAVPPLLLAVGIDFGIHAVNRYREERVDGFGVGDGMRRANEQVLIAFFIVTVTTVIGFLANLMSSLVPIREFGIVASVGIVFTFLVFGVFLPASKVLLDRARSRYPIPTFSESPFGDRSVLGDVLGVGTRAARVAPVVIVVVALLGGGLAAGYATGVDTTFEQEDFLPPEEPPEYYEHIPEPLAPSEYSVTRTINVLTENFESGQADTVTVYLEGPMENEHALESIRRAGKDPPDSFVREDGSAEETSIRTVIEDRAERDPAFAATVERNDRSGNGVPDRNLGVVYDELLDSPARDEALQYVTEDRDAARIVYSVEAEADDAAITEDARTVADRNRFTATATGETVVFRAISELILQSAVVSLAVALTGTGVFLVAAYHVLVGRAGLGVVNLFPVLVSVAAIGATMRFAGVPFNAFTATLLAITIGIGIDYSVHITHRFVDEFEERGRGVVESLDRTVSGTGGALTGSVLTTATGIGVLVISPFPAIGQFGLLTALSVVYAYLAAMFLLPAALVCWAWLVRGERPATGVLVYK